DLAPRNTVVFPGVVEDSVQRVDPAEEHGPRPAKIIGKDMTNPSGRCAIGGRVPPVRTVVFPGVGGAARSCEPAAQHREAPRRIEGHGVTACWRCEGGRDVGPGVAVELPRVAECGTGDIEPAEQYCPAPPEVEDHRAVPARWGRGGEHA